MALTKKVPSAPSRPNNPKYSSTGKPSSPQVPTTAATSGGNNGTWYSSRNSPSVVSQELIFSQPDFVNCQPT